MRICIITVRKNSQRFPGKNRKFLGNKLLSYWTIDAAIKVSRFDEIRLITDDMQINAHWWGKYASNKRIQILPEPAELATNAKHIDAIIWGLDGINAYDEVILLQPTNPFRTYSDINYFLDVYKPPHNLVAVDPNWKVCGAIYIIKFADLLNHRSFNTPLSRYIPLPFPNYIDINTKEDWEEAEQVIELIEKGDIKIDV